MKDFPKYPTKGSSEEKVAFIVALAIVALILGAIFGALLCFLFPGEAAAADGSAMKDPLWRYNSGTSRDNIILRDATGGWKSYFLRDPILRDGENYIRFDKDGKKSIVIQDPIIDRNWIIWDLDPVGE